MLNLIPQAPLETAKEPLAEPVSRVASLFNALRLVEEHGGGPASDFDADSLAKGWENASDAERRCFDRRSAAMLAVASAGLEVVLSHRDQGSDVSPAAMQLLADEIRAGLEGIEQLVRD